MSQAGILNVAGGGGGGSPVQTLTGDTGGAVPPTANNINIIGGPGVSVAGTPGTSTLQINVTDQANAYTNVTFGMSPYSVTSTDFFISVDATAGPVVINLLASPGNNREYVIKDRLGQAAINTITINAQGGDTIDGAASYVFTDAYESVDMIFHGTNYEVF